jgi:hypothetical protein
MPTLRIEHPTADYEAWKKTFDSDPFGRAQSGVRRYRVMRATDDPNYVMVDLEFETVSEAEAILAMLRELWGRVQAEGLISSPQARIVETVEAKELERSTAR